MKSVSIIVALYHPDYLKLGLTLKSIISQKDIDFEVLLSDDGSRDDELGSWISNFFLHNGFNEYTFIENKENQGTIKNVLSALNMCNGEFVYLTSPGDLLFDDFVLHDFYVEAQKSSFSIHFGNAVSYSNKDDDLKIMRDFRRPKNPYIYNGHHKKAAFISFVFGNQILGAACFVKCNVASRYFSEAVKCAKYMEDTVGYTLAMLNGEVIKYYDRNMIWYENGYGISTQKSRSWEKILSDEKEAMFAYIKKNYPSNPIINAASHRKKSKKKYADYLYRILFHPIISLKLFYIMALRVPEIAVTDKDIERLRLKVSYNL